MSQAQRLLAGFVAVTIHFMAVDVSTPVYEGPFDLLLHLILKEQVDIYEVSLSTIVDAYLAEIERMQGLDLDIATEFLLIASTLVGSAQTRPTRVPAGRPRISGSTTCCREVRRKARTPATGRRRCPPAVRTVGIKPRSHQRLSEDSLTPIARATCFGDTSSFTERSTTGYFERIHLMGGCSMNRNRS